MSSPGGILPFISPDLAAQQQAVDQRRALAQSLLGQQPQYTGIGGAADTLGSKLLGAFLAKGANKDSLNIARQYQGALGNFLGGTPNAPQAPTQMGAPQQPPLASMPPGGPPAGAQQPQGQPQPQASPGGPAPAGGGLGFGIPGTSQRERALAFMMGGPQEYAKAVLASEQQPENVKAALFAHGGDAGAAQQDIAAQGQKAGTLEFREKGFGVLPGGQTIYGPNEESNTYFTTGPNNEPIAHPIQQGAAVAAQQAGAIEGKKEANKIIEVTLPDGRTVPMYAGNAIGQSPDNAGPQQSPPGIRNNNPGNLQPGGQEAKYANPTAGILAASSNIDNYAKNGINTLQGIVSTWAPQYDKSGAQINDTPAYIADVSKRLGGIDPTKPLNLSDPNVKGALLEAMFQHENGNKFSAPGNAQQPPGPAGSGGMPALGVSTAQHEVNKAAGEAAANSAHVQGSSDALIQAIKGMIAINDQVPDSTFLGPETKAKINEVAPNLLGFRGDSGALHQWEQLNSIGILGGIKNLGMGRTDIPIVKQVVAGGGIPANVPAADRLKLLQTLLTEVQNNKAAAQNTASNLNRPNAAAPPQAPMGTYPTGSAPKKIRIWNPQTGRLE